MDSNDGPVHISIVTACLNASATIRGTLNSIQTLRCPNLEYIIIDGASTDDSLGIIGEYAALVDRLISEPDDGISAAFNKGIHAATGDVIGIVSADDRLVPGALEAVARRAREFPDVDVFFGDVWCVDQDLQAMHRIRVDSRLTGLCRGMVLKHAGMWVRRTAYEKWGCFDRTLRYAMDYELALRFYRGGARFQYVPEVLGLFRTGGINERHRWAAIREVENISVHYGYPPALARCARLNKLMRYGIKKAMPRPLRRLVLPPYRQWKENNPPSALLGP